MSQCGDIPAYVSLTSLIPYSFAPLILFNFHHTLDSPPVPFPNGTGGVDVHISVDFLPVD